MFGKRGIGVASVSLALIASCLGWAAPAAGAHDDHGAHGGHGGHGPVTCQGRESTMYSPGLTLTPQSVGIRAATAYTCSDRPGHTIAATGSANGRSPESTCLGLHAPAGHEVLRYGDGSVSEISYPVGNAERVLGVNTVMLKGVVVAGRDKGAEAERFVEVAPAQGLPLACLTPEGVRRSTGVTQLRIIP
ncbi:hypothetical protein [Streptomyces sp. NPDC000405]|uniref:hypothetical protein n=1 Tax=Streptomyces sp. NPDC000405 TaxID=3161033 RepID=UPI00398D2752